MTTSTHVSDDNDYATLSEDQRAALDARHSMETIWELRLAPDTPVGVNLVMSVISGKPREMSWRDALATHRDLKGTGVVNVTVQYWRDVNDPRSETSIHQCAINLGAVKTRNPTLYYETLAAAGL